ncbi:hypothetical protein BRADI_1g58675v3 [Brachypodium distachyon]|uniref:Uncharacterized protein n=1 Tax=Brachypodium distachyon TaxID=15368 RepID=A0A2K2DSB2_BRADI|nr:hypothetical protein BRADI_1g58675v3 [Brachypodium distachyon]
MLLVFLSSMVAYCSARSLHAQAPCPRPCCLGPARTLLLFPIRRAPSPPSAVAPDTRAAVAPRAALPDRQRLSLPPLSPSAAPHPSSNSPTTSSSSIFPEAAPHRSSNSPAAARGRHLGLSPWVAGTELGRGLCRAPWRQRRLAHRTRSMSCKEIERPG